MKTPGCTIVTLRSLAAWLLTWLCLLLGLLTGIPWLLLSGRMGFVYAEARLSIRVLLAVAGVRVRTAGDWPPVEGAPIYMANHLSHLDPPVLLAFAPGYPAFLAKRELFRVPVLGAVMRWGGMLAVDRGDREAAAASLDRAAAAVRGGRPVIVFPEGTRSRDGALLPFKKGPFFLAEAAAVPVVPVVVAGTDACLRRGDWRIHPGVVTLRPQPALRPADWEAAPEPRSRLAELVRARLVT